MSNGRSRIVNRVHVERDVVVLKAAELVLPCSRPADREIAAGEEVVLVRVLVGIGRKLRIAVEPPVRLHPGPTVVVTGAQAKGDAVGDLHADVAALQRVGVGVVDALALGVELVGEHVVVEDAARAGHRSITVGGGEVSAIGAELNLRRSRAAGRGPKLHDAGHGVGSVHRALRTALHLKPLDVVHGNDAEVEEAAGIVHRHAIDQHLVVVGFAAADEQARQIAAPSGGADDGSRNVLQGIAGGDGIEQRELVAVQHADRCACLLGSRRRCRGGDDHGLRRGRQLQLHGEPCVCGMETCSDCSANPGASTTARYWPSGRLGKVAVPSPAVVCTADPDVVAGAKQADLHAGDAVARRALYGYFEIGGEGAVQHSSATSRKRERKTWHSSFARERGW